MSPVAARREYQLPNYWQIFGHSWTLHSMGTLDQSGRFDSIFRSAVDVELAHFRNWSVTSSRIMDLQLWRGGWARFFDAMRRQALHTTAPYAPDFGGALLCWGINDLGNFYANGTQKRTAISHVLRAVVSRCRAARVFDDADAAFAYGAGYTSQSVGVDNAYGGTVRRSTATTGTNTITFTIPADYGGQPLVFCFHGTVGATGGTVTFTGTAGVTGTFSTSNINATGGNVVPIIRRITTLTAANAGQTVIMSTSQIDAGGQVNFDSAWLEADTPPPVVVCNIARIPDPGYTSSGYTQTVNDTHVTDMNTDLAAVVAEFDGMVQVADLDGYIGKVTAAFASDNLHFNERGAAEAADAVVAAVRRMTPVGPTTSGNFNPPAPAFANQVRPALKPNWYTAEYRAVGATAYTPVVGDTWALPLFISNGRFKFDLYGIETLGGTAAGSIHWSVFDDPAMTGYPYSWVGAADANSSGTPFTVTTGAGVKTQAPPLTFPLEPGLYWLVFKVITTGTGITYRTLAGPNQFMPNLQTTGAVLSATTAPMAWKLTGQGTTWPISFFPTGAVLSDLAPAVAVRCANP